MSLVGPQTGKTAVCGKVQGRNELEVDSRNWWQQKGRSGRCRDREFAPPSRTPIVPQLNGAAEHARKVTSKKNSRKSTRRSAVKKKRILFPSNDTRRPRLHFELVLFDKLPADAERFLFRACGWFAAIGQIVRRGAAHDGTRLHAVTIPDHVISLDAARSSMPLDVSTTSVSPVLAVTPAGSIRRSCRGRGILCSLLLSRNFLIS